MAISRYKNIDGDQINVASFIRKAAINNIIDCDIIQTADNKRLDHYANEYYGDGSNWWLIAAASGIGWWLQVPNGIVLRIPKSEAEVLNFIESI